LAPILDPGARAGLTLYMMGRVVRAIAEAGVEDVCVVSPDRMVLEEAKRRGATPLVQESRGLNPALEEGRRRALELGASTLLVLPADLPLLDAGDVRAVLQEVGEGPSAVISPDGGRSGTNALLIQPPDVLPFAFGADSFEAHLGAARRRSLDVRICERPHLAFDLDTAGDLARLGETGVARP
jgi:2-phospho-L-lactate/phosphoenolpyruvate guanylyltransferase